jgi:putative DNA primase/helicase
MITDNNGNWPDPIPLEDYSKLPQFLSDSLDDIGNEMVRTVSEVNQVDTGLTGTIYLAILSTCLAKKGIVDLKTHTEPINLYVCSVLPSGERKSSTSEIMSRPIYLAQRESLSPVVVDDVTPEKLGSLMAENDERMAILSSEGGIFDIMAGRYGKKLGNLDLYLKAHAGDSWSAHRISREANTMTKPALTICLTVQPELIKQIGSNNQLRGRGLLARFLYCYCKPQAGFRTRHNKELSHEVLKKYADHIVNLMNIPLAERIFGLTKHAQGQWDNFYNTIEVEMREGGRLYLLRDWGSKLAGATARISGLLHMAKYGAKSGNYPIDADTVMNAITFGGYFMEHAIATFGQMTEDSNIESAKKILGHIMRDDVDKFRGREVIKHTGIRLMDEVNKGLKVLLERCYIKECASEYSGKGRPENTTYQVNPKITR